MSYNNYCISQIKKFDYFFYLSFLGKNQPNEILTLYNLHLEFSKIPLLTSTPETALIRFQWWYDEIDNILNKKKTKNNPVLKNINDCFANNQKILNKILKLIEERKKESFINTFNSEIELENHIKNTNFIIWEEIYFFLNNCKLPSKFSVDLLQFVLSIKYLNIAKSLYSRNYNNHFFISEEIKQNFIKTSTILRQEEIFRHYANLADKILTNFNIITKRYKDLKCFNSYSKHNLNYLSQLKKHYKTNSLPPSNKNIKYVTKNFLYNLNLL